MRRRRWPPSSARKSALLDRTDRITIAEAQAELARAVAQLKILERLRKLRG